MKWHSSSHHIQKSTQKLIKGLKIRNKTTVLRKKQHGSKSLMALGFKWLLDMIPKAWTIQEKKIDKLDLKM